MATTRRRRRWALLAIGIPLLLGVGLVVWPRPAPPPPVVTPEPAGDGSRDLEMTRGVPFNLPQPIEFPPADSSAAGAPPPPPPAPDSLPPPPPPELAEPAPEVGGEIAALAVPEPSSFGAAAADSLAAPTGLPEVALRPVTIVHPRVPEKIVQKRKIDASVVLQARVDATGHVREVRLLRRIDNCEECNQSAVEAVERMVYDAPPAGGEVWTVPFEMRFTHRR